MQTLCRQASDDSGLIDFVGDGRGFKTHLRADGHLPHLFREVMWGCEFPPAAAEWFVNLPPYGFNWWLIGEVEPAATPA